MIEEIMKGQVFSSRRGEYATIEIQSENFTVIAEAHLTIGNDYEAPSHYTPGGGGYHIQDVNLTGLVVYDVDGNELEPEEEELFDKVSELFWDIDVS